MKNNYLKTGLTVCVAVCMVIFLWAWVTVITECATLDYAVSLRPSNAKALIELFDRMKLGYIVLSVVGALFIAGGACAVFMRGKKLSLAAKIVAAALAVCVLACSVFFFAYVPGGGISASDTVKAEMLTYVSAFWSELVPLIITSVLFIVSAVLSIFIGDKSGGEGDIKGRGNN